MSRWCHAPASDVGLRTATSWLVSSTASATIQPDACKVCEHHISTGAIEDRRIVIRLDFIHSRTVQEQKARAARGFAPVCP